MSNLRVGVEVAGAYNLLPKDGQGSSSAFVELSLDEQKFRTTVKEKDLNPYWNETFYFNISNPDELPNKTLEAHVYHDIKNSQSKSSLGKVRIAGTAFVSYSDAVVSQYPLEKGSFLSRSRGELGLKVFVTDDPYLRSSNPPPQMNSRQDREQEAKDPAFTSGTFSKEKKGSRRALHHLPNAKHQQQQFNSSIDASQVPTNYGVGQFRAEPLAPNIVQTYFDSSSQPFEFALKETSPVLGGGQIVGGRVIRPDKPTSTYDLVEPMEFLYVRVVKARDLPSKDVTGSLDPYVEVRVGNYRGVTNHFEKMQIPVWNAVFAFSKDRIQSSVIEVVVKDKNMLKDDFVGMVRLYLHDIPRRVPPDSPLAPEWYRLEAKKGEKKKGELMLAVWMGTQADEAYADAWHSDSVSIDTSVPYSHLRSKVYHSPRLWYVRVNVIEAQDLVVAEKNHFPDVYVKVQLGNQVLKTKPVQTRTTNTLWNEDLMFVAAEPFEENLIVSVEDRTGPNKEDVFGRVMIPLNAVERRINGRIVHSQWFNLQKPSAIDVEEKKKVKFATRLQLRVSLEGGYHVLDESTHYSSDLRPTAKQLWKPPIGILAMGVLSADGLQPMKTRDGRGTSDTYCVAKYGQKWIRTRTVIDSLNPKYNEQYTWEVFDPATVLTVGVFDSSDLGSNGNKDKRVGKVRIRLSTLETGRVYTHSYPLLVLHPSGVKKMGELHLAIRFSCTSFSNMMLLYSRPLLPKMHYVRPLNIMQQEMLRHQAVNIVAARLSRAEPPLKKEVVGYMTDADSHLWSMRRSKANFFRLISVFSGLFAVWKWFGEVCMWKNPVTTCLVHFLFLMLMCFPELILPTGFLYMFVIGIWNYRFRPKYPPHMNTRLSYADAAHPDELDEEFDTFPTTRSPDILKMRYDRLRSVAGRVQTVVGDLATQGERIQALLSWRDPRATVIFVTFCLVAAIVLYVTPFQALAVMTGFYVMRHPRFRHKLPAVPLNFFRRLPARTDSML